ncbi:hypothetical protein L3X38_024516 [Prunus dulcis]|uniref:Ubiquitin-like protease family profile domain-containing protein n=1 Tax=Prunus dulcis TaxID=3755 RepID=A0AAD4W026_PRUDU|nr:hypothetical protein L3X38_024516 [Prunus dulcis]
MPSGGPMNPPSIPKVSMAGDEEGSASVEKKKEVEGKWCRKKRPSQTLLSPFTDPVRKKRTMSVSDATATLPSFDPSKPLPIKDVKEVIEFCTAWKNDIRIGFFTFEIQYSCYSSIAEVQWESCSIGADFFYKLIDDTKWISSRHLDMATFLIRKRQLSHPLVFETHWTMADYCLEVNMLPCYIHYFQLSFCNIPSFQCLQQFLEPVKSTAKKRGSKKAATSNTINLLPSKLNNIHHYVRGTWQHGYGQAWTKVRKVYFLYNLEGSHWVTIEIDFVRHTATVYDSYVGFTKTSKLARVLYNMQFYEASEVEEVKQQGLKMSRFTPFLVCSIGDVPLQRDG